MTKSVLKASALIMFRVSLFCSNLTLTPEAPRTRNYKSDFMAGPLAQG